MSCALLGWLAAPLPAAGAPGPKGSAPSGSTARGPTAGPNAATIAGRAKAKFEQGLALSDDGKWVDALMAFRESNDLVPSAVVQYNIAVTLQSLGKYLEARKTIDGTLDDIAHHKLFLKQPGLKKDLTELRESVGAKIVIASLKVSPADGRVEVDGAAPEPLPDGRVELDPGRHLFVVTAPGHDTTTVTRTLEPGEIEIALTAPVAASPPPPEEETPWYLSGWFWGVGSGVVAAGVAIAVIAVVAQPKSQEAAQPPDSTYGQVLPAGVRF